MINSRDLSKYKKEVGLKTWRLKELKELGLKVPEFCAILSSECVEIMGENGRANIEKITTIIEDIPVFKRYAVRSSALIEDTKTSSCAGKFNTVVDVPKNKLEKSIADVLEDAYIKLDGKIEKFSLILQKFEEPDFSGVAFTRDPQIKPTMRIEYVQGRGEEVVSGITKPEVINSDNSFAQSDLPNLKSNIKTLKIIEEFYGYPQDIEFCVINGVWFYLQSRPITTFSKSSYQEILYLERVLPREKYFFEKTQIYEVMPRPSQLMFSLINKFYEKAGPIDNVYRKFKIEYTNTKFLKILGNELFVDRELELKSLFGSMSYFNGGSTKSRLYINTKTFQTLKNILNISKVKSDPTNLMKQLDEALRYEIKDVELRELIKNFEKDYELIFEVNLVAQKYFDQLKTALRKENVGVSEVIGSSNFKSFINLNYDLNYNFENLVGNSFDIADTSQFVKFNQDKKISKNLLIWWSKLNGLKKEYFKKTITSALVFDGLREISRWLTVKNISAIRERLKLVAKSKNISPELIYFATIDEIISNKLDKNFLVARKLRYQDYNSFCLESVITNLKNDQLTSATIGISFGKAKGLLVDKKNLKNQGHKILFSENLTPDLTQYFDEIDGIVSARGGLLSHLAIIAREKKLPVISGVDLKKENINLLDEVEIDGTSGAIKKI